MRNLAPITPPPFVSSFTPLRALIVPEPRVRGHCVFCGYPCEGEACGSHQDLLRIERNAA